VGIIGKDRRATRRCSTPGAGRLVAGVASVLLLAGCDASPLPPAQSTGSLQVSTLETPVTAIGAPSPGEDDLVFTVDVPSGGPGCASRPRARVVDFDRETLRMQTVVESNHAGYCTRSRSRTFSTRVALEGRQLVVNDQSWEHSDAGDAFVRCSVAVGCNPPDDRCDPVWTATVTPHFDLPPEKHAEVVACSGRWLVLDVNAVVTGCQPVDGSTPPAGCSGRGVHRRWFAELDAQRNWQVVASGTAAGCADAHRLVPSFPNALCAGLPAP
jgi:hypothetical protein